MKKIWKILLVSLCLMFFVFAGTGIWFTAVTKDTILCPDKLVLSEENTEIFDVYGNDVKSAAAISPHAAFPIRELPEKVKYAFIDTEDRKFYSHGGFDVKRMAKAAWTNLCARSFKEGASTISQQLIKNTHLSQEKTLKRKMKELKLTAQLEKRYSKDEILEKYLNTIYFGHSCFGIKSAAEFYFDKSPASLDLADAAILAGLVKSPNNYSPFKHPDACMQRKKRVLQGMYNCGHIDETQFKEALEKPLPLSPAQPSPGKSYAECVFDELEELSEKYSFTVGGNIRIYSFLDQGLQKKLEEIAASAGDTDKIFSVLDVKTHGFKGYYSTTGNIRRLPGSLIKPLLVYAPALETDAISPATPILDEKVNFGGYEPKNFNGEYSGYLSARECLAKSVNIPAVKILNSVGIAKSAAYLKKMGLEISEDDYSLALALGGMKKGFTLNEILNAYNVFPNGGEYSRAGFIRQIDIDGHTVYQMNEKTNSRTKRIFSEETAYLVNDMLKTAAKEGTAKKLRSLPFPIAAKTGTAGTGGTKNGNTDAYALSYTTKDCVGVWLGNADNSPTDITGGGLPANIALKINEYLYNSGKPDDFSKPAGIEKASLDKLEYYDAHNIILADDNAPVEYRISEIFKKSTLPHTKSSRFSHPIITSPTLNYEDDKVIISFSPDSPEYYSYLIDRYDYATHTTVYSGKFIEKFSDSELENGKSYVYTVIPLYKDRKGKEIILPTVTTKKKDLIPISPEEPPEIVDKDWWNY